MPTERLWRTHFLVLCALTITSCTHSETDSRAMTTIKYQGTSIATARPYADIHAFKDDPNNLNPEAVKQIETLLKNAPFGPRFASVKAIDEALFDLAFPGYGFFFANQIGAKLDPNLEIVHIEVPRLEQNRYVALERKSNGEYVVVADFVAPSNPELTRVRRSQDGKLEFGNQSNPTILRRAPS